MAIRVSSDPSRSDWFFVDIDSKDDWTPAGNVSWLLDNEVAVVLNDDPSLPCERGPTSTIGLPTGVRTIQFHLPRPAAPGDFIVIYWGDQRSVTSATFKTASCPIGPPSVPTPLKAAPAVEPVKAAAAVKPAPAPKAPPKPAPKPAPKPKPKPAPKPKPKPKPAPKPKPRKPAKPKKSARKPAPRPKPKPKAKPAKKHAPRKPAKKPASKPKKPVKKPAPKKPAPKKKSRR